MPGVGHGERYLVTSHEVQYAPRACLLGHLGSAAETASVAPETALGVGLPNAAAPRVSDEAKRMAATRRTRTWLLGPDATVARVIAVGRGADIFHLACHRRFLAVNDGRIADLMTTYDETWCAGAAKPAALRAAQLASLAQRTHPAFWAPFIRGGTP